MNSGTLGAGFVIDLLAAILAACLLSSVGSCGRSYWCRVGFVAGLGVFVALVGHMSYWNWMHFPLGYTLAFAIDVTVGWSLAGLAIAAIVRPSVAAQPAHAIDTTTAAAEPKPAAPATPKAERTPKPTRNDAITLLATLQREARLIDIVKEPLGDYTDAQVGAAARDVLRDCGAVLDRLFQLAPIVAEEEGASIEIPQDAETAARYRLSGNVSGDAQAGVLVHHGWQAKQCELPKWSGSKELAMIVSPAELEVK